MWSVIPKGKHILSVSEGKELRTIFA